SRRLGPGQSPWTVLQYLDFGRYFEVARSGPNGQKLEELGSPPHDWKAVIDRQNKGGGIQYRNHLAHGGRFDYLPRQQQVEAADLFRAQSDLLRSWWPRAPIARIERPIPEVSPY